MPLIDCQCLNKRVELSALSNSLETLCRFMFDTVRVETKEQQIYCMTDDAIRTNVLEMLKETYEKDFQAAEWQRNLLKRIELLAGEQLRSYIYNLYMNSIGLSMKNLRTARRF